IRELVFTGGTMFFEMEYFTDVIGIGPGFGGCIAGNECALNLGRWSIENIHFAPIGRGAVEHSAHGIVEIGIIDALVKGCHALVVGSRRGWVLCAPVGI